jgi:hypothetical protein
MENDIYLKTPWFHTFFCIIIEKALENSAEMCYCKKVNYVREIFTARSYFN